MLAGASLTSLNIDQPTEVRREPRDWDPGRYQDCYRERLRRVIDAKRKRKTIEVPKAEKEPKPAPDQMAALERTLEELRDGGDSKPRSEGREKASRR